MSGKKMVRGIIGLVALCLFTTAGYGGDFRLFVMGGGSSFLNSQQFVADEDDWTSDYAKGGKAIIGAELPLSKILGLEAAYSYGRNNLRIENDDDEITGYGIHSSRLSTNFVLHTPKEYHRLRPYLTAGLEYNRFIPNKDVDDVIDESGFTNSTRATLKVDSKFGFNYGAGLEYRLLRNLGLRLDVRNHLTGTPTYKRTSASDVAGAFPVSGLAQNVEYAIGVVFRFKK